MPKMIISASVDVAPLLDLKARGINISALVNKAIIEASNSNPINIKVEILRAEANNIENKQKEIHDRRALIQKEKLNNFLTKVSMDILNNEVGMAYWTKETGLTIEELAKLKKEVIK